MCNSFLIETVKKKALSQRNVFLVGQNDLAAASYQNASNIISLPSIINSAEHIVDMTHRIDADFPNFLDSPGITYKRCASLGDDGYNSYDITLDEHFGTHIDAPLHFSQDGKSVDQIELNDLICPLAVVDIRERAAQDADTMLTPDDIMAWIKQYGPIPDGACVAMNSGWGAKVNGAGFRNIDEKGVQHYPGFHPETAEMLLRDTTAVAIASDTLSLDTGASTDFGTHCTWLPANRYGIECLAALDVVPTLGATLIVGAPKIAGGTGGQARIFALF